jgi:hypothetical protein
MPSIKRRPTTRFTRAAYPNGSINGNDVVTNEVGEDESAIFTSTRSDPSEMRCESGGNNYLSHVLFCCCCCRPKDMSSKANT